jgi:hypothetical protein
MLTGNLRSDTYHKIATQYGELGTNLRCYGVRAQPFQACRRSTKKARTTPHSTGSAVNDPHYWTTRCLYHCIVLTLCHWGPGLTTSPPKFLIKYPKSMTADAHGLIEQMLQPDVTKRLGVCSTPAYSSMRTSLNSTTCNRCARWQHMRYSTPVHPSQQIEIAQRWRLLRASCSTVVVAVFVCCRLYEKWNGRYQKSRVLQRLFVGRLRKPRHERYTSTDQYCSGLPDSQWT